MKLFSNESLPLLIFITIIFLIIVVFSLIVLSIVKKKYKKEAQRLIDHSKYIEDMLENIKDLKLEVIVELTKTIQMRETYFAETELLARNIKYKELQILKAQALEMIKEFKEELHGYVDDKENELILNHKQHLLKLTEKLLKEKNE